MRILNVTTDPDRRGAQVFAQDLGRALGARGHDVHSLALAPGSGSATLDVEMIGRGTRHPRTLSMLRAQMVAVDITIAHGGSTGPACAIAGGGRRRPFVYRQISDSRFWAPTRSRRWRVRLALSRARVVIALSEYNRHKLVEWIGVRADDIRVVPNGAPSERFAPTDDASRRAARAELGLDNVPTIAFVGALVPEKGGALAIDATALLPDAVQLVVAGDGPERRRLEALAVERAPGRVHFLGSQTDVGPVYRAADIVVFPTRGGDAMPATIIEAGLSGIPVVATAVGAIPEMVVNGETGVVIATDRPDDVASAVHALLVDPARTRRLGAAARERCLELYAIERVAERYEAVLREALAP